MRAARRIDASFSSVALLPRERMAAITCERLRFEKTSAIVQTIYQKCVYRLPYAWTLIGH
jgi:hypothetical protein